MTDHLLQKILLLEPQEQARLLDKAWETLLRDHPEVVPVTKAQRNELDRRLARHRDTPHTGIPAETVHAKVLSTLPE